MPRKSSRSEPAFTLVEMTVAMAVLSLILVLCLQLTGNTSELWRRARSKIDTFQEARAGFEALTRGLSQAMLNSYWDYDASTEPGKYAHQSDLHFVCGPAADLITSGVDAVTHAVFFQAPLGVSNATSTATNVNLLNVAGYFVESRDDSDDRPSFLKGKGNPPPRKRYRLVQLTQPTELFSVYSDSGRGRGQWFRIPVETNTPRSKVVLAENIVAVILLPKRPMFSESASIGDSPTSLAPNYFYDSRAWDSQTRISGDGGSLKDEWRNQLPPIIQVTLIAIDEKDAARIESQGMDFARLIGLKDRFRNSGSYHADLSYVERALFRNRINYRLFTTDIGLPQGR